MSDDDEFSMMEVFAEIPETYIPSDDDMVRLLCPRPGCHTELRTWKTYLHPWGDTVESQCDKCGMIVRACNNLSRKKLDLTKFNDSTVHTLKDVPNGDWAPDSPAMKKTLDKLLKKKAEADKEANKKECILCEEEFIPRANAKSDIQLEYCNDCRESGAATKDMALRKEKAKMSSLKAKSPKKAKITNTPVLPKAPKKASGKKPGIAPAIPPKKALTVKRSTKKIKLNNNE